ncbi:PAS domain S-box protein [Methanosarcina sp.]|uniref:PAS domain S-box protein n=1 Tax=Methanosarcina sp. TaxID=2213 RepID=UPI003C736DF9
MRSDSKDKKFQESEKLYRMLFDYSMDGIILTDPRDGGKILSANPAACRMLGWTEQELIGKGRDIMFDLRDPGLSSLLDERARSGSARAQLTYRRRNGTTFPGEVSTAFFIDNNGEPRTVAIIRDITDRKQTEEALSRERSLLESVTRATDLMLALFDPQFNFVWVNPAYAEASQMKPEEMVGKNHFELYPHEENEAIFMKVRDTGEGVFYKDKPFVYPDHPERGVTYWDWSLEPVKNSDGNVTGLVLSLRETTKYKQEEKALREAYEKIQTQSEELQARTEELQKAYQALSESEEHYRMLFTNMTEGFALTDVIFDEDNRPYDYRYLEVNPAYELSLGVKKDQVLGRTVLELFPKTAPTTIEKFGEVAHSGKSTHFKIFSQVTNKYVDIYAFSPEKGKLAYIFRDITERKQMEKELHESEERFAVAFRTIPEALVISDVETGLIVDVNDTWTRLWGYSRKESIGRRSAELGIYVNFADRERCMRILEKEGLLPEFEIELRTRKGDLRHAVISTEILKLHGGQLMLTVIRDITERKQAEEALRESETRFRTMFEVHGAPMLLIEPDSGQIIDANDAAARFYEYSREQLRAMCIDQINQLPPEEVTAERYKAVEHGKNVFIFRHRLASGDVRWVEVYSSPVTIKGQPILFSIIHDITQRKQAEEALRKSEESYRTLFTNMTEGFLLAEVISDENGKPYDYRYLEINPVYEYSTGLKKEQVLGKSILEIVPNTSPILIKKLGETAVSGEPTYFEIFSQITGKYFDTYVFSPGKGKVAATFRDITKRKQAEEALRESEEKYRNIVETANEGIWTVDPEARTTYANEKMAEMLGYTQEEMIGRPAWDFTSGEGKVTARQNMEKREKGIDEGYEIKLIRKDGSPLWAFANWKSLFDKKGKFIGSMAMVTDITARKEAETKLKETLDNLDKLVKERTVELQIAYDSLKESEKELAEAQKMAHLGNWYRSIITDKIYWSDETYRIYGLKPQELEVNYNLFLNYVHPDDRDHVDNVIKRALNDEPYSIDFRIISASGEEHVLHSQGEVIFDEKNTPIGMRGTVQDITEQKRAEEALARMEKIRIKEIHHRIKNNLQVISSLLDLQSEAFSHLEVCKVPEVIEAFTESQNRVISMALIHEELYKGEKIDTLDFSAYLRKLTEDLFSSYNLGDKDINFKLDLQQVDLGMDTAIPLGIIVNELVSNAFNHAFSDRREGEIKINLRRIEPTDAGREISSPDKDCMEKDGLQYTLTVADNGRGIPEKIDFRDTDSLGLQLVNILVEQIDGCVELKSDKGTEFTIWFNNIET